MKVETKQIRFEVDKAFFDASWRFHIWWDNGAGGEATFTFRDNGTFVTSEGTGGRFFQIGARAVLAFHNVRGVPDWSVVYSLTVNNDGQGLEGIQGWSHTSGSPKGTHSGSRVLFQPDLSKLPATPGATTGLTD